MDWEKLAKDTVKNYYSMSEEQREFILTIINSNSVKWTRIELMKALILFNKAKEINCGIDDKEMDPFAAYIDEKGSTLNALLIRFDKQYREEMKVI